MKIKSINKIILDSKRYDIETASHNFFANGILVHNSSTTVYKKHGIIGVCSRNLELLETENNTLWNVVKKLELDKNLPDDYAIQGEVIGEGIQGNPLKQKGQELYVFNVYDIKNQKYLDLSEFVLFCMNLNVKTVPIINSEYEMNYTIDTILISADGPSLLNPNVQREGIVVRPVKEGVDEINGSMSRLSFKTISNNYLLNE